MSATAWNPAAWDSEDARSIHDKLERDVFQLLADGSAKPWDGIRRILPAYRDIEVRRSEERLRAGCGTKEVALRAAEVAEWEVSDDGKSDGAHLFDVFDMLIREKTTTN